MRTFYFGSVRAKKVPAKYFPQIKSTGADASAHVDRLIRDLMVGHCSLRLSACLCVPVCRAQMPVCIRIFTIGDPRIKKCKDWRSAGCIEVVLRVAIVATDARIHSACQRGSPAMHIDRRGRHEFQKHGARMRHGQILRCVQNNGVCFAFVGIAWTCPRVSECACISAVLA
jgi:hypothetical protein